MPAQTILPLDPKLDYADLALEALAIIARVVGGSTAASAASAMTIIRIVLHSLDEARIGKVTPEVARAAMSKLRDAIHENDEAADAALAERFKPVKTGI